MSEERRRYSRIAFHSPGRLVFIDCSFEVVISDVSLHGALIRLPPRTLVENDALCILHIRLNRGKDQISMECSVAHVEGRQAGLLCLSIDLDSATHLRRLVELNTGDPALLERELSMLIAE
jgi:hypothetical protein